MNTHLVGSTDTLKDAFRAMFEDFRAAGELEWCENNSVAVTDFKGYVLERTSQARGLVERGWVPTSHYWLVQDDQIVGSLRIRHYLNSIVRENTGHVGYDIAPSFRRKGLGSEILRLGLLEADKLGIGDILAHCEDSNIASRKIIQGHGGIPEEEKRGETWYRIKRKTSHPTVREARLEDAAAIAEVHVASWRSAYRGIMPDAVLDHLSVAQRTERWRDILQPSERLTLVLEVAETIQGWASIGSCRDDDKEQDSGELYGLYLDHSVWSKNVGTMLYLRAETAMRASGFAESRLWVLEANERARRFYEKAGYAHDGHTKCIQREGAELTEVRYKKSLQEPV